jgi:hypothetical protein
MNPTFGFKYCKSDLNKQPLTNWITCKLDESTSTAAEMSFMRRMAGYIHSDYKRNFKIIIHNQACNSFKITDVNWKKHVL